MMSEEQEHRFLGSGIEAPRDPFSALSSQGSGKFVGVETFDNPGCAFVSYTSDEVVAKCPITGQPDYYVCEIVLLESPKLLESKSIKLWFNMMHEEAFTQNVGLFCENLAVYIKDQVHHHTECDMENIRVTLTQKARGGISIKAIA